jgi:hypothetical protein
MTCKICRKEYSPECDYNQGRCPHHKPMIEIQPKDTSRGHFYVSLAKSFLRISGGVTLFLAGANPELMTSWLKVTAGFLMLAECLGILEELV